MLQKLLNSTSWEARYGYSFEVKPLRDPGSLVAAVRDAFAIPRLISAFHRPNPFDVEKEFHEPLEKALDAIGGEEGKADIRGTLDKDKVIDVIGSHAASGEELDIYLKPSKTGDLVRKRLGKEYLDLDGPEELDEETKQKFMIDVEDYYEYFRRRNRREG